VIFFMELSFFRWLDWRDTPAKTGALAEESGKARRLIPVISKAGPGAVERIRVTQMRAGKCY
jgi:hypothetical protein